MAKKSKIEKGYEIVEGWSESLDVPVEEIMEEIKDYEEKIQKEHPKMSKNEVRDAAIGRVFASKQRHLTDIGTVKVIIKLFCNPGTFDWVATKKAYALAKYDTDPDKAVREGFVRLEYNDLNEVVNVIPKYYWAKNRAGGDNKKLGEDLPEYNFLWNLIGVGLLKSELDAGELGKKIRKVTVNIPNEYANPKSIKFKQVVLGEWISTNIKVTLDDKKTRTLYLEAKESTNLTNVIEHKILNRLKTEQLPRLFKSQLRTLDNLTKKFEDNIQWKQEHSRGTNDTFVSTVFVVATDKGGDMLSPSIAVTSQEIGILDEKGNEIKPPKVWWKDSLPLDFGEGTKLVLFYRMKQNEMKLDGKYMGEWGNITFDAQGYIMLLKVKREVEEQEPEPIKEAKGTKKIEPETEEDIKTEEAKEPEEELGELDDLDEVLLAEFDSEEGFSEDEILE